MAIDVIETKQDAWTKAFEQLQQAAAGKDPGWLHHVRQEAFARFRELGFPTVDDEEWRFTNPASIAATVFRPAGPAPEAATTEALRQGVFASPAGTTLVFVNGRWARERSTLRAHPDGVIVGSLGAAIKDLSSLVEPHLARYAGYERHAFTALNTAFAQDGAFVYVPRGAEVAAPIQILHLSAPGAEPTFTHPRTLIVAERGARATVLETFTGDGVYLANAVTEIVVGENASIEHVKVQRDGVRAFHVGTLHGHLKRDARLRSLHFAFGGRISRTDLVAVLDGEGSEAQMHGLYAVSGDQLVDNHTLIDHARPHGASREIYKGILAGSSRGVFNGKVYVRPDAQKTDGKQTNKNLLLSDDARVNTKPQLEIFANDVKCTHGATIGQLEEEQVFYLRSRGIGERQARGILTHAFANEILDMVNIPELREQLDRAVFAGLPVD